MAAEQKVNPELFGRDNGPRLPTFIAAISSDRYLFLLDAVAPAASKA